jgi:hypothetical protein
MDPHIDFWVRCVLFLQVLDGLLLWSHHHVMDIQKLNTCKEHLIIDYNEQHIWINYLNWSINVVSFVIKEVHILSYENYQKIK